MRCEPITNDSRFRQLQRDAARLLNLSDLRNPDLSRPYQMKLACMACRQARPTDLAATRW